MKAKEQKLAEQDNQKRLEKLQSNVHKKEELIKLSGMLRVYYIQRNVSHMFMVNVIDHACHTTNSIYLGKSNIFIKHYKI